MTGGGAAEERGRDGSPVKGKVSRVGAALGMLEVTGDNSGNACAALRI